MASIILERVDFLCQFDNYVRDVIGEETIIDYWLTFGLQDGWDEDDLFDIAEDDDLWVDAVKAFDHCCKLYNELKAVD